MIQLTYQGEDITNYVSINKCVHDMYAEERADSLYLWVNDLSGVWSQWQPQKGELIAATYGAIGTGNMYIYECTPHNGRYLIKATALPPTYAEKHNKAWQKVRLLQIGQEIASRHGLEFASYDVTDYTYDYVLQSNQDDFSFLSWRATLEGCAVIVCDGRVILYDQMRREVPGTEPQYYLELSPQADYEYHDRSADMYGSCIIERGAYSGSYRASNGNAAVLRPTEQIYLSSNAEAERFAKNLLYHANKRCKTGYIRGQVMTGYAAGSTAVLKNISATAWDGSVFLTHVRNDYGECMSKLFFRQPVEQ